MLLNAVATSGQWEDSKVQIIHFGTNLSGLNLLLKKERPQVTGRTVVSVYFF